MPLEEFLTKVIKKAEFFLKKTTVKSKNESSVGEDVLIVSSQASEGNEDHQQSKPGPEEAGRQPKISPRRALPRLAPF